MTVVGLHDFVKVSISALLKSFLLIMCIDAPEPTTNSLSSGLRVDGAGKHLFSEGEKNVVLCFSSNLRIFWASFHVASRAHRSCHSVSSWDRSSNFWIIGVALMRVTWANHSKRWILSVSRRQRISKKLRIMTWLCRLGTTWWRKINSPDILQTLHLLPWRCDQLQKPPQLRLFREKSDPLRTAKGHSSPRPKLRVLLPRRSYRLQSAVKFDVVRDLLVSRNRLRREM